MISVQHDALRIVLPQRRSIQPYKVNGKITVAREIIIMAIIPPRKNNSSLDIPISPFEVV